MGVLTEPFTKAQQKYCMDCGALILRRAEICPKCGCSGNRSAYPALSLMILLGEVAAMKQVGGGNSSARPKSTSKLGPVCNR